MPLNGGTSEWKSVNLEVGMPYFGVGYRVSLTSLIARIGALELIGEYSRSHPAVPLLLRLEILSPPKADLTQLLAGLEITIYYPI